LWGALRVPTPQKAQVPPSATKLDVRFDDHIRLVGYDLARTDTAWSVKLYWQVDAPLQGDYTIFVHAEADGKLVAQQDSKPLDGRLPTWSWVPGEVVTTEYTLTLPPGISPDTIDTGMYSFPTLERLKISQGGHALQDRRVVLYSTF
jgi:hypothetical protein